jgi:hypothetical protein
MTKDRRNIFSIDRGPFFEAFKELDDPGLCRTVFTFITAKDGDIKRIYAKCNFKGN